MQGEQKKNNAVYVTSLPADAESADSNKPRIKLYADAEGNFKGDALIGELFHFESLCYGVADRFISSVLSLRVGATGYRHA